MATPKINGIEYDTKAGYTEFSNVLDKFRQDLDGTYRTILVHDVNKNLRLEMTVTIADGGAVPTYQILTPKDTLPFWEFPKATRAFVKLQHGIAL